MLDGRQVNFPFELPTKMKPISIHDNKFINEGKRLLDEDKEILVLIRYPYMAGSMDFMIIKSYEAFMRLLNNRKPKDSVSIMKSFVLLKRGIVDDALIADALATLEKPEGEDWLLVGKDSYEYTADWHFAESIDELREELEGRLGNEVSIIREPDWMSNETTINAYAPDPDGKVRPGAY